MHDDETTCAYDFVSNYDVEGGTIPITDERIKMSQPFEGHHPEFLKWPDCLWRDRGADVPCSDPDKNAYHIRFLAETMQVAEKWIGCPLAPYKTGRRVQDGSHRLRAAKYLRSKGMTLEIPFNRSDKPYPHAD